MASTVDFVFSAVDMSKDEIKAIEEEYAKTETPVVSNNSAPPLDAGCADGRAGDQRRPLRCDPGPEETSRNNPRIHRGKTELLHPELCSVPGCMERIRPERTCGNDLSGNLRSGKTFKDWPEMVGNIIPFIGGEEEKSEQSRCVCSVK